MVDARQPGQIYLSFTRVLEDGSLATRVRDIRLERRVPTDWGDLKVYRRRIGLPWLGKLTPFVQFLRDAESDEIQIRHHYAE